MIVIMVPTFRKSLLGYVIMSMVVVSGDGGGVDEGGEGEEEEEEGTSATMEGDHGGTEKLG